MLEQIVLHEERKVEGNKDMPNANVEISWLNGQRYLAIDSTSHSVVLSPPNDVGMKPPDLMLLSLAACSAFDVVKILQKQRATLAKLDVKVSAEQSSEAPWPFTAIHLRFELAGEGITQKRLEKAIELSMNQYCSVRASLSSDIAVTFDAVVEGAEEAAE
jgi:putative redox protein